MPLRDSWGGNWCFALFKQLSAVGSPPFPTFSECNYLPKKTCHQTVNKGKKQFSSNWMSVLRVLHTYDCVKAFQIFSRTLGKVNK